MTNGNASSAATTSVPSPTSTDSEVRLLLICQAEGLRNRYQNLAGYEPFDDNSGLTALGWEQANLLAAWLKTHERIDILISAPQLRSRLTAQRIGQVCGTPIKVQPDLPRHAFERIKAPGGSGEATKFPLDVHAINYPGDEEYQRFAQSVMIGIDKIVRENWGKTIAVVMSGVAIAATLRYFLGAGSLPISIVHTGIAELTRRNQQWSLLYINRREHMPITNLAGQLAANPNDDKGAEAEDLRPVSYAYDRIAATVNSLSETERAQYEKIQAERLQRQRQLLKFGQLPPDLSVIEVGAGTGQLSLDLAQDGAEEVVGIDISAAMLEAAEYQRLSHTSDTAERVSFRLASANAIPFADARFDAAIMHTLLHHSQKPAAILQEVARILKSSGTLLLAELIGSDDAVKRATYNAIEERRSPAHAQVRTVEQLRKLITGAGLTIEAEKVVTFDRDFDEWLNEYLVDETRREVVRKMVEAGLEANAAGLNVRRQGERLIIEQKLLYVKAKKK